ncbi:MAG TPA: DUF1003 domain-containing protein [Acidimicrobiales bacterium]|nr:DUF1003 domain-containing protein [Acidimicrobiales bacterium]
MDETHAPLTCAACRALDRADGVEDGNLFATLGPKVRNESRILTSLMNAQDKAADRVTGFAGSMKFVYLHSAWFGVWILINIGILGAALRFDKFPFGLLTMIVSLEAIFLSTFVMISQNRQAERSDVRSELDFEANLRSEIWSVHIGHALGVDPDHVEAAVRQAVEGYRSELASEAGGGG